MFGFIGIKGSVVFRIISILFFLWVSNADATVFRSSNVFLKSNILENKIVSNKEDFKGNILIFINPSCSWCQKSLNDLSKFRKRRNQWEVKVYVMASLKEFIDFFHEEMSVMPMNLDYTLDYGNTLASSYGISETPTYIITKNGKTKKVEGYVDFDHLLLDGNF